MVTILYVFLFFMLSLTSFISEVRSESILSIAVVIMMVMGSLAQISARLISVVVVTASIVAHCQLTLIQIGLTF